jgi:hypothetical protein
MNMKKLTAVFGVVVGLAGCGKADLSFVNQSFDDYEDVIDYTLKRSNGHSRDTTYAYDTKTGALNSIYLEEFDGERGYDDSHFVTLSTSDNKAFKKQMIDQKHPVYAAIQNAAASLENGFAPFETRYLVYNVGVKPKNDIKGGHGKLAVSYNETISGVYGKLNGEKFDETTFQDQQDIEKQKKAYFYNMKSCDVLPDRTGAADQNDYIFKSVSGLKI